MSKESAQKWIRSTDLKLQQARYDLGNALRDLDDAPTPDPQPDPDPPPQDGVVRIERPGAFFRANDTERSTYRITHPVESPQRFRMAELSFIFNFGGWGRFPSDLFRGGFWLYLDDEWHETIGYVLFRGPGVNKVIMAQKWGEDQRSEAPLALQPGPLAVKYRWTGGGQCTLGVYELSGRPLVSLSQPAGHSVIEADKQIDIWLGLDREHNEAPWGPGTVYSDLVAVFTP